MATDYIDRVSGEYFFNTTKKAILEGWNLYRRPPKLVPLSRWTVDELSRDADIEKYSSKEQNQ